MSAKVVSSVPFHGTKEQKEALDAVIARYKGQQGCVMPAMQEASSMASAPATSMAMGFSQRTWRP